MNNEHSDTDDSGVEGDEGNEGDADVHGNIGADVAEGNVAARGNIGAEVHSSDVDNGSEEPHVRCMDRDIQSIANL